MKRRIAEAYITACGHITGFNSKAIRSLKVYLVSGLQFRAHKNLTLEKERRARDRVRRLTAMRELTPELVRQIQVAAVKAVILYETKIWWNGQKGWCEEYQKPIN